MDLSRLDGYEDAVAAMRANIPPRFAHLQNLEDWISGNQYDGLPDWFDESCGKPLWERAPCVVYLLAKGAVASNVDLVLGEGRFPTVTSSPCEDDSVFDGDLGLDEAASEILDRFIAEVFDVSRFKAVSREVLRHAQSVGSGCAVFGARNGRLFGETIRAQWCTPTLDAEGSVVRLVVEYPYLDQYRTDRGEWRVRALLYRREIDAVRDVTMLPAVAEPHGRPPRWVPDTSLTVEHNLGFAPVVWYPHLRGCANANDVDGSAIHAEHLDEIRALDFALSQRHRAALYCGDPQWTECGVEPGHNPTGRGRRAIMPATERGGAISGANPVTGIYYEQTQGGEARRKGPGVVWQYPSKDTRVELHALPADALGALFDHARDLRSMLGEQLAHVFLDPESVKFAATLSGKAMRAMRERQLNHCDSVRDDFGQRFVIPATNMLLAICAQFASVPGALRVRGLLKVAPVLQRFTVKSPPSLRLVWGDYAQPDPSDELATAQLVKTCIDANIITRGMALEKLRGIFSIQSMSQVEDELDEQDADRAAKDDALAHKMQKLADGADEDGTARDASGSSGDAPGGAAQSSED